MALIKDKRVVTDDPWLSVADGDPIPATGDVLISWQRFDREDIDPETRDGRVGLRIEPEDDLLQVITHLPKVGLLAIDFPKFGDGRGYSKARLLRERYQYKGELRAVGEVLTDQLFYMLRCGFDSFQLAAGKDTEAALRAFETFTVKYQAASDEPRPLYVRAHRGEHA
jgi:uncharacterized protein (DUF934 family)